MFAWGFSFCERGNIEIGMTSKFELEKFAITPTEEKFEKCRKDDLLLIADFSDIVVPGNALKREVKEALHTELVKQRILPVESVVTGVASSALSEDLDAVEAEIQIRRWGSHGSR